MKPLIVRAHKYTKEDPDESTHASRYNGYIRGALDERKRFAWLPIDRDENGFATEECLRKIEECYEKDIPVVIAYENYLQDYDVITPCSRINAWLYNIEHEKVYTHYLPIPKLEE